MKKRLAYVFAVLLCLSSSAALAHGLNVFVRTEGGVEKGNAYFTGGVPAKNVKVQVVDAAGQVLGEMETDAEGNFTYSGKRPAGPVTFVASTPDGHRAESKLDGAERAGPAQANPVAAELVHDETVGAPAVASSEKQLGEIQVALDRLEQRLWLRDVIGGIGYIFGLAGLWALWKSRQGRGGQ